MEYREFIAGLIKYQTESVQFSPVEGSCSPHVIYGEFLPLFQDINRIIQLAKQVLCQAGIKITIFGLQAPPISLISDLPTQLKRIFNNSEPNTHLCCCLQYCLKQAGEKVDAKDLSYTDSIFIDFTSGEIGGTNYYMAKLRHEPADKYRYGSLDYHKLSVVWRRLLQKNN